MGRRGPKPQPTAIKIARGNPGKRRINRREPKPEAVAPSCPSWLDREGKRVWNELLPQLQRMGVLSRIDRNALARYCAIWSRWRRAEKTIEREGATYTIYAEDGVTVRTICPRPEVAIANKAATELRQLEAVFGMNPSARSSLKVEQAPVDEFAAFLREKTKRA